MLLNLSLLMGVWIARNGFTYKWFRPWVYPAAGLVTFHALFRIQHWPGSFFFLVAAACWLAGLYAYASSRKASYNLLDLAKLLWAIAVGVYFFRRYIPFNLHNYSQYGVVVATCLLTVLYMVIPENTNRKRPASEKPNVLDWEETQQRRDAN